MSSKGFFNSRSNKKSRPKKSRSVSIASKKGIEANQFGIVGSVLDLCFISESDKTVGECRSVFFGNSTVLEIGNSLNKAGGLELMVDCANAFSDYLYKHGSSAQQSDARELEFCWDGIGEWKA